MNNYSLESFINFCDDMQIAEEGLFSKLFKKKDRPKKVIKVNNAYKNRLKYNAWDDDGTELLSDEELSMCDKKYIPEFKKILTIVQMVAKQINSKYKKQIITLLPDSFTQYEIIMKSNGVVNVEAYPVGITYDTLNTYREDSDLNDAIDEFEQTCLNKIPITKNMNLDMQFFKDNCDAFPKYVNDCRRFLCVSVKFKP